MAVGEVGRKQVETFVIGPLDQLRRVALEPHELAASALHLGPDPEQICGGPLRVEVPEQRPGAVAARQVRKVHGGRGLPHATLDVVGGEDLGHVNVSWTSLRWRLEANAAKVAANSLPRRQLVLFEPLDQHPHRHQRSRAAGGRRHLAAQRSERGHLDLAILVAAEHVLQRLQRLDHRLDDVPGEQRRAEQLEQVAELLALLAELVVFLRRAGGVDRVAHPAPSARRPSRSARRRSRRSGAGRVAVGRPAGSVRAARGTRPSPPAADASARSAARATISAPRARPAPRQARRRSTSRSGRIDAGTMPASARTRARTRRGRERRR